MNDYDTSELTTLISRAWDLLYVDGRAAGEIGQEVLRRTAPDSFDVQRAYAAFHVAFANIRFGQPITAVAPAAEASRIFDHLHDARGMLLCLELAALQARAEDRLQDALALHQRIQGEAVSVEREPIDAFISANSRAITRKLLGQREETLADFYIALSHAKRVVASRTPQITAMVNIGGCHADLFNFVDARAVCEQAFMLAKAASAWTSFAMAGYNLIEVCEGVHEAERGLAVARELIAHEASIPASVFMQYMPYLAVAFLQSNDFDEAHRWLERFSTTAFTDGDGEGMWVRAKARQLLGQGLAQEALHMAEGRIEACKRLGIVDQPYGRMKLLQVATDACEALGDFKAAFTYLRQSQIVYAELVTMGAAARSVALQSQHELEQAERDRDRAMAARESAEQERQVLEKLNAILEEKVAESTMLQQRLSEQALRDALTGLHNRRFLLHEAPDRLELARRQGSRLCIALLDIDDFKRVNDSHGHDVGDDVLQTFAQLLVSRARRSDIVCRYGGEEFVLMASDAEPAHMGSMLDVLMARLSDTQLPTESGVLTGLTFSAGIACFGADGGTLPELLKVADQRLYQAKNAGKARIHYDGGFASQMQAD